MISAKEILRLIRYKTKDNNEIRFSDYDIKNALNEALRYIGQSQSLQNNDFLEAVILYDEEAINKEVADSEKVPDEGEEESAETGEVTLISFSRDGVDLPSDFQLLSGVTRATDGYSLHPVDATQVPNVRQYKVSGGKIYAGVSAFYLTYKKTLDAISNFDTDTINLPTFCTDIVVKITVLVLEQAETDVLLKTVESTTKAIIPRRKYNNAKIKMPFKV